MRARRKQKRVFQHQSRTSIPPETISDEVYNVIIDNKDKLDSAIIYNRDFGYDYF